MDNSNESDMANHWSTWIGTNRVPPTLYFEDGFRIRKPTDRHYLVTIPLEDIHGQSGRMPHTTCELCAPSTVPGRAPELEARRGTQDPHRGV